MDLILIGIYIVSAIIVAYLLIFKILGLRIINSNEVGVIEKWWSFKGSLKNSIIAFERRSRIYAGPASRRHSFQVCSDV